jgi:hypothetical protein
MSELISSPLTAEFERTWKDNSKYFSMLALLGRLSKLFGESPKPFLDYRWPENAFCRYYGAINDARSCTSYDARWIAQSGKYLGVGIKTFGLNKKLESTEKIAEFNKLKAQYEGLKGKELAVKLGTFRNDRIEASNALYNVAEGIYHIVGRLDYQLLFFNTPYEKVDVENIADIVDKSQSLSFNDGKNEYIFNKSKSVLEKKFSADKLITKIVDVSFIEDPFTLLEELLGPESAPIIANQPEERKDYVILPLYSTRDKLVSPKSGLNQWHASGRPRNEDEVYIPVPKDIHKYCQDFFPNRDTNFDLIVSTGHRFSAKICQSDGKALMSNPNSDLGHWILRDILKKNPGELVTMDDLNIAGIDSVIVERCADEDGRRVYKMNFSSGDYESYEQFITQKREECQ